VLLLDSSAQIFVNGCYLGEYGGEWQNAVGGKKAPAAAQKAPAAAQAPAAASRAAAPAQPQAAPVAKAAAGRIGSKAPEPQQGAAPEEPRRPSTVPSAAVRQPPKAAVPAPSPSPANRTYDFQAYQEPTKSHRPMKPEGLDKSDKSMQQLINEAKNGNVAKVNELLASGIDPDGPAKDGKTPLMAATTAGHVAVVEALLGAYADPTLGKNAETPLTIAFQKGNQK